MAKPTSAIVLDFSWPGVVLQQAFNNENSKIKRFCLNALVDVDLTRYPQIAGAPSFFLGPLLAALNDPALFRPKGAGTLVSPFGDKLGSFLRRYVVQLEQEHRVPGKFLWLEVLFVLS